MASLFALGLVARLELSQTETLSFSGVVIALNLVCKGSILARLDIGIELDVQRASPVSVSPSLAWSVFLFACWWAKQRTHITFAPADELDGFSRGNLRRRGTCGIAVRFVSFLRLVSFVSFIPFVSLPARRGRRWVLQRRGRTSLGWVLGWVSRRSQPYHLVARTAEGRTSGNR